MKAIKQSIGWSIHSQEDVEFVREFIDGYKFDVQLGFFSREDIDLWLDSFLSFPIEHVSAVHLPKGLELDDFTSESGVVHRLSAILGARRFVVHPWSPELPAIVEYVDSLEKFVLCLENFGAKNKDGNPFTLLAQYGKYLTGDYIGLCLDFSHLGVELAQYPIIRGLLPYTKMLHVSDRIGKHVHCPLFRPNAGVNGVHLLAQIMSVKNLRIQEVVLEYDRQYQRELCKHIFWLVEFVTRKRLKCGD